MQLMQLLFSCQQEVWFNVMCQCHSVTPFDRIGGISPRDISDNAKGEREKGNEIASAGRDKRPDRFSGYPGRQPYVSTDKDRDRLRRPNGHNQEWYLNFRTMGAK